MNPNHPLNTHAVYPCETGGSLVIGTQEECQKWAEVNNKEAGYTKYGVKTIDHKYPPPARERATAKAGKFFKKNPDKDTFRITIFDTEFYFKKKGERITCKEFNIPINDSGYESRQMGHCNF